MTVCAIEPAAAHENGAGRAGCTITADGCYAARLALAGDSLFPERWILDGPEPYAVPLPGNQPEEPGTEVQPLADGRVLIHRPADGRHAFSLLYPTGPGTGELPLGTVDRHEGTRLRLLPRPRTAAGRTPSPPAGTARRCGSWRAARPGPSGSRRSPAAARAGRGWTARAGCSPWTGRRADAPSRSWSTSDAAARRPRCCRSPPAATTGYCSPTRTAVCC